MGFRLLVLVVLLATPGCERAEYSGPCSSDADCDDDNVCTSDFCTTGECHHTSFPDGLQCNDGSPCTTEDACASGQCQGTAKDCSAYGGQCTQGTCDTTTGECGTISKPDGTGCDDGQYCTDNDSCRQGTCAGDALDCGDGDDCTLDECSEGDGECIHTLEARPGQEMTSLGNTCSNGIDDDCDQLTDDQDPNCSSCSSDAECGDGNECTDDTCVAQECQNDPVLDGTGCDDGRFCTVGDVCTSGVCAGVPRSCTSQSGACTESVCSEGAKTCEEQPTADGVGCDDSIYCTVGDACNSGICQGAGRDCNDDDICTLDNCNEDHDRCDHTLQPIPGAEGPSGPTCANEVDDDCDGLTDLEDGSCYFCQGDPDCEDNNPCTTDVCDSGQCQNDVVTDGTGCEDGLYCTDGDNCIQGVCTGQVRDCSDIDDCTQDACDEDLDTCTNIFQARPELPEVCGDAIDQDCDGITDGCCMGTGMFLTKRDYDAGSRPHSIAVGDFDADGILDLAVTENSLNQLNILLGNGTSGRGSGTFATRVEYSTGDSPRGIAAGDFNADGILDLVVAAGGANNLNVFLGNGSSGRGDGTFTSGADLSTGAYPISITVGDFNADGRLDLAAASRDTNRVNVFIGNGADGRGDGTFATRVEYSTGNLPWGIANGDFNTDGILDLVVTNESGESVSVLLGNGTNGTGDGSFAAKVDYPTGLSPRSVAVGDFNADGILDLAVSNDGSLTVSVLIGNGSYGRGNGAFSAKVDYTTGSVPWGVLAGDFDRNGILDLAVVNQDSDSVSILLGDGSGGKGDGSFGDKIDHTTGTAPLSIATGHLNADNILDLVAANNEGASVSVFLGAGSGSQAEGAFSQVVSHSSGERPHFVTAADFNRDGILDLAVANLGEGPGIGSVSILLGQGADGRGAGTFGSVASMVQGNTPGSLVAGDFDTDSILDLAVANRVSDTVSVFLGDGTGGRGDGTFTHDADHVLNDSPFGIATGDFNGDKIQDLVVTGYFTDMVYVMLGNGTGGRGDGAFPDLTPIATGAGPYSLVVADFDDDNISDLAVANSDADTVSILLGNGFNGKGNGTFAGKGDFTTGNDPRWLAVGDVNSDAILDLAVGNFSDGSVSILLGNGSDGVGDGTLGPKTDVQVGGRVGAVALTDVDADGILDLVVANYDGMDVSVISGNGSDGQGNGTFGSKTDYPAGDTPTSIAVGDFNADGVTDLAVTSKFDYSADVLLGQRQCLVP